MAQAFNLTAQLNLQGPANIGKIVSDLKKQIGTIEGDIKFKIDASTVKGVTQLNAALQTFNSTLGNTTSVANNAANALNNLKSAIGGINLKNTASNINAVVTASQSLGKATKQAAKDTAEARTELEEFGRQSALAVRRFAAFSVVSSVIFKVNNAVNQGVAAFIDYERQLFKLQQITGSSQKELGSLSNTIGDLAIGLGVASSSLISIADTLAQAGLTAKDTEIALKALALTELAPSFDSLNETVEGSIALMRQFDISARDLQKALGSINAVAARFAVESSDLITAIQRTGGVFATASKGVSGGTDALNEFLAVFTSVRATTRESAETIATGLRTIFTRIQREDTIQALEEYGVQLTDVEGKFIGAFRAVEALSRGLSKIDPRSLEFASIVEELGGFRQIGKVIPLIQQFATAQEALKVAQTGQDSLAYDAVVAQQSLANQIAKVREQFLGLVRDIGQSQGFQFLVKGALSLTSAILSVADAVKGVLPILALIGLKKGLSAATQFGKGFIGGLKKVQDGEDENPTVAGSLGKAAGGALSGAKAAAYTKAASAIEDASDNFVSAADSLTSAITGLENKITELNTYISSNIQALQNNTASLGINTASLDNLTQAILNFNPGGGGPPATINKGGKVMGFARGGVVPGSGNRDTVPAMLQPGEFVIRKKAVETIGSDKLHKMNKYAAGGVVIDKINKIDKTVDGDTFDATVTPKVRQFHKRFRVAEYDAWEQPNNRNPEGYSTIPLSKFEDIQKYNKKVKIETKKASKKNEIKIRGDTYVEPGQTAIDLATEAKSELANKINTSKLDKLSSNIREGQEDFLGRALIGGIKIADRLTTGRTFNLGGKVQKFAEGGVAQRRVGYIDYDVIANEANKGIVEAGMKKTGITGPRLYSDYLTDLAVKARKESNIDKLRAIYGVAGSGKTTLARGQGTDDARLRKTERFPILSPEDVEKATEIIVLASSVSKKKLEELFSQTDRTYTLSSTTQAEKETIKNQRVSRDITGVGLEGRTPGSTTNVANDTAVGEALLTDALGEKSVVLGRTDSGKLRRKSGNELVDIIKKKIGFTWGGFAPMTAGHESIMDAASAMGISPEDFIYLVGANEGVKSGDASSYRTAIFDQDARVLLAKAGAGAKGATVLPKPRDFEVPQGFDISPESGRRKVLLPGKGSTAFVADKGPEETKKYKDAGYGVKNLERTGGISGTLVRDLIAQGDLAKLQSVLSPNVYDLISNNIGRIQNRANILPSIIEEVNKTQGIKLEQVDKEIQALGITRVDSKKVASDPEYAAKVEVLKELRAKRDKIKSAGSFEPYRLLAALAAKEPDKYGLDLASPSMTDIKPVRTVKKGRTQKANLGGLIQRFMAGGVAEDADPMTDTLAATKSRKEILDLLKTRKNGLQDTAKEVGVSTSEIFGIMGTTNPDEKTKALQEAIRREYVKTYNRQAGAARGTTKKLEDKGLVFAAAGIFGKPFPPENIDIVSDRLKKSAKVRVISGVMDKVKADQIDQLFTQGSEDLAEKAASIVSEGSSLTGKTISNPNAEGSIQGGLIEKMVQKLGGPGKTAGQGFDFPNGLQGAAKYFNIDPDLPTDVKRTLEGPSTFTNNIVTYLKNVRGYASGGFVQRFLDGGWVKRMKQQNKDTLKKDLQYLQSNLIFAGDTGAYIPTYDKTASEKEKVDKKELLDRYQAMISFLNRGTKKGSPLKATEEYSQDDLLDAIKYYQGGSGPLARAMVNQDFIFTDRDEAYETEDVVSRLKASAQYKAPKKLYTGLGRGQINEMLSDAKISPEQLIDGNGKIISNLVGQTVDFPTFLSTSLDKSVAEGFIGDPGALMTIDSSKSKQLGIDIGKAKGTTPTGSNTAKRLPGLEKINPIKLAKYDQEEEFVLQPGARFKVLAAKYLANKKDEELSQEEYYASMVADANSTNLLKGTKLDLKAQMLASGGAVSLYHGSNTGVNDSVLESFRKEGAKSNIAQGYGQGAGFYVYSGKEKAKQQAMMRVNKGLGSFTIASGDTEGKPMVLTFRESLDPETWDLDYELNKGAVVKWLVENYDKIKDKVAPKLTANERLTGIKDVVRSDASKGIMSDGIRVQSDMGTRSTIYSGNDSNIREGELIGQIMNRLQAQDPKTVADLENQFFNSPSLMSGNWDNLALKYVGLSPLMPTNIETFAKGGSAKDTVPALLTPGEFVINKQAAQKIGYSKLGKLNQADKLQGYNKGGVVGGIQTFAAGGTALDLITSYREQKESLQEQLGSATGGAKTLIQSKIKNLEKEIEKASSEFDTLSKIISASSSKVEQRQANLDNAEEALIQRLNKSKFSGVDFTALPDDIQAKIFEKAKAGKYQVGGKDAFGAENKAIAQAQAKLDTATQVRDRAKTEKETKFGDAVSQEDIVAKTRTAAEIAATEEAKKRAEADSIASRNAKLLAIGLGIFDGVLRSVTQNMTGLSKVIADVVAGASGRAGISKTIYDELTKRDTVRSLNKVGKATGINTVLESVGLKQLGTTVMGAAKAFGPYIAATYIALGAIKDFANGVIEQEKKLTQSKIEQSTNRISYLFDKMSKDINQAGTIAAINSELDSLASSLNRQVELNQKAEYMWTNILDWLGQSGALGADVADRANQRGMILKEQGIGAYLSSAISDLGFGSVREENYNKLIPKIVQQRAEEGRKFSEPYSRSTDLRLRQGEDISSIMSDLGSSINPSDRAKQLATQDIEVQSGIEKIRSGAGSQEFKEKRIAALQFEAANAILAAQLRAQEAAIVAEQLNKIGKDFVTSIQRLMKGMEESIGKATFTLQELSNQAKLSRESLTGKAGAGAVNLKSINVIRNAGAYSPQERSEAFAAGGKAFGIDSKLVEGLLSIPNTLEDRMSSSINKTIAEDRNAGEKKISTRVEKAAIDSIRSMNLGGSVESLILKQTRSVFAEISKKGEDTISFRELAERIPLLGKQIEAAEKTQQTAIKALELWQSVLNSYSEAMNRQVQDQIDINSLNRKAADIRSKGEIALSDALGKEVSLRQKVNSALANIQSMTGGEINPGAIGANILNLETVRQNEQDAINAVANSSIGVTDNFQLMSQRLASTNLALRENYAALESLANNSDIASAALGEIQQISGKIKAGESFIEKLVTSSPEEINKLNRSFGLLSNNLKGQANIGTTSEERSQTLQLFNTLGPLLGTGQKQNELRANVLESMLKESGISMDSNLSAMIDAIKNPERNTEMQEAISLYRTGVDLQAKANTELSLIKETLKQNDLAIANQQLIAGFSDVMKNYQQKQLTDIAANTRETADRLKEGVPAVGRANGGIIYASAGQSIFKPKGSDTVPAMLTPGEFVVNRKAASQNLPLLESINNGYARGGKVSYYADGGYVVPQGTVVGTGRADRSKYKELAGKTLSTRDQESDYKYPKKEFLEKLTTPEQFESYVANRVFYTPISDKIIVNGQDIYKDLNNTFLNSQLKTITRKLNEDSIPIIGDAYDTINYRDGSISYKGYNPLSTEKFNAFRVLVKEIQSSDTEKIRLSEYDNYKNFLSIKKRLVNSTLKPLIEANKKNRFVLSSDDALNKNIMNFPASNIEAIKTGDLGLGGYDITGLSAPLSGDKLLGFFSSSVLPLPSNVDSLGIGTSDRGFFTIGQDNIASGSLRKSPPNDGIIFGPSYPLNSNLNRKDIFTGNSDLASTIDSIYTKFTDKNVEKFSSDTKEVKTQKDVIRKLMGLYNGYFDYIDLNKSDIEQVAIDPSSQILQAQAKSVGQDIFPVRIYRNDVAFDNKKIKQLLDNTYSNTDFIDYIYDGSAQQFKTSKLELEKFDFTDTLLGKKTFSSWLPSLPDSLAAVSNVNKIATGKRSPIKLIKKEPYNDPNNLFSFLYRQIDPNSLAYDEVGKRFIEESIGYKYRLGAPLITVDEIDTVEATSPFQGMLKKNESLIIPGTVEDYANKIRSAFLNPKDPDPLLGARTINKEDRSIITGLGYDSTAAEYAFYDKVSDPRDLSYSEAFIQQYNKILDSNRATAAAKGAAGVSKDLVTDAIDASFDRAKRVSLGRIAYDIANQQGLNFATRPETIDDLEYIRGELNSRIGRINDNTNAESIRLEAWRRLFTEISGTAEKGLGRSYLLAGSGIDLNSIGDAGSGWVAGKKIDDPALKGKQKTLYYDNAGAAASIGGVFNSLLQREINILRAQRLGADATLGDDVAAKARGLLKDGMFFSITKDPTGKGRMRAIDNQEPVLGTYGDIFKYALTPSNIFADANARGQLIDELINYYQNALGKGGELVFEKDYRDLASASLTTLKSWYADQDSILNTGIDLDDSIGKYDESIRTRDMKTEYDDAEKANKLLTSDAYGSLPQVDQSAQSLYSLLLDTKAKKAITKANGGLIYASGGSLVNFQARGTDTVPAMLTPGEFVVNRASTQRNLPLLQAINKNKGGKVSYFQNGGVAGDIISEFDPKNSPVNSTLKKIDNTEITSLGVLQEILRVLKSIDQKTIVGSGGGTIRNWHGQNQQTMPEPTPSPRPETRPSEPPPVAIPAPPAMPEPIPNPRPPTNPEPGDFPEETGPIIIEPPEIPMPDIPIPDVPDWEPIPFPEPTGPEIPIPDVYEPEKMPELPSMSDLMAPIPEKPAKPLTWDYTKPFEQKVEIPERPELPLPSRNTRMQDVEYRINADIPGVMTPEQEAAYRAEEEAAVDRRKTYRQETINRNTAIGIRTANDVIGPGGALTNLGDLVGGETTSEQIQGGLGLASNVADIVANLAPQDSRRGTVAGKVGAGADTLSGATTAVSAIMEGDYARAVEGAFGAASGISDLLPEEVLGPAGNALGLAKNTWKFGEALSQGEIDAQSGFAAVENAVGLAGQVGPFQQAAQGASRFLGPAGAALETGRGAVAGVMQAESNNPLELATAAFTGATTGDYELGGSNTVAALNKMGAGLQQGGIADIEAEYIESLLRGATSGFQTAGPAGAVGGLGLAVAGEATKAGAALYKDTSRSSREQAETDRMLERSKTEGKSQGDTTYGLDVQESQYVKTIADTTAELERLKKLQEEVGSDTAVGAGVGDLIKQTESRLGNQQQGLTQLTTANVNAQTTTLFELGPDSPEVKARLDFLNQRIAQGVDKLGKSLSDEIDPEELPSLGDPLQATLASYPTDQITPLDPTADFLNEQDRYPVYQRNGGLIYANNGALINFQPRGSDTVPAMLTPGEFVVNRDSTQKHLSLLRSINSGEFSHGGLVSYLKDGGLLLPNYYQSGARVGPNNAGMSFDISNYMNKIIGQIGSGITEAVKQALGNGQNERGATGGVSTNIESGINSIDQFVSRLDRIVNALKDIDIPPEIKIVGQHDINVVINGDTVLNQLKPELAQIAMDSIKKAFSEFKGNNPSWQDSFNFDI